jgi:hypothetical protein
VPEGLSTHLRATAGRALPPYQDGSAHYCFAQQPSSVVIGCRGTSPQVGMPAADKDSLSFANPLTGTSSGTFDREQQQSSVRSMRAAVLATDPKAWTSGLVADVVTHGATAQERLETHANAVFARIFRAISRKTSSLRQGDVIEGMVAIARMWHFCDRAELYPRGPTLQALSQRVNSACPDERLDVTQARKDCGAADLIIDLLLPSCLLLAQSSDGKLWFTKSFLAEARKVFSNDPDLRSVLENCIIYQGVRHFSDDEEEDEDEGDRDTTDPLRRFVSSRPDIHVTLRSMPGLSKQESAVAVSNKAHMLETRVLDLLCDPYLEHVVLAQLETWWALCKF